MSMPTGMVKSLKGTGYNQVNTGLQDSNQRARSDLLYSGSDSGVRAGLNQWNRLAQGDQSLFSQLEAPALRQFGELQGNLGSRFAGFGSGAINSSGFKNTANQAVSNFSEQLQSQRLGMQNEAVNQLIALSESLMNRPTFETSLLPKQRKNSFLQQFLSSILSGASGSLPGLIGSGFGRFGGMNG